MLSNQAVLLRAEPPAVAGDAWKTLDPIVRAANRGVALMERYEYSEAVKAFEQVVALVPESPDARVNLAIAIFNRSGKGDLEQAEKLFDEVLADQPDHARALYFRGVIHQYSGRDEQALSCFERLVKRFPNDGTLWYLLSRSKTHLGQPCQTELQRAVAENPALASAHYDLMRLAWREGREDEARTYQETFTKLRQSPLCDMVVIPHYRQMGALAVVQPMTGSIRRPVLGGELGLEPAQTLFVGSSKVPLGGVDAKGPAAAVGGILASHGAQFALADVNGDNRLDIAANAATGIGGRALLLLLARPDGGFRDATEASGLKDVRGVVSCAFGDYDNDGHVDLFLSCTGLNHLFRGRGDGTFVDVTEKTGTGGPNAVSMSAAFLDADHDGDLDIFVCQAVPTDGTTTAANQLLNNNTDGTFTDIASTAGVACADKRSIMLAPADIDGDRDTDLVVFHHGSPADVFFNDRLGRYHRTTITTEPIRGDYGGILQDFNGDGRVDLLVLPGPTGGGRLYLTDGTETLKPSPQFNGCLDAVATWGGIGRTRVADIDLDGDLDIAVFGAAGHVLLNDGYGRFVTRANVWPAAGGGPILGQEMADLTGDGLPDLLRIVGAGHGSIELVPTKLTPSANWLSVTPTGDRGEDKRTRSPASGFGTRLELHCGLHGQVVTFTGLGGGLSQSVRPVAFGLSGAVKADYLSLTWPDGVTQCENELTAGSHHRISELERRVSSCPVLFAWNGKRFGFVSDFAGVGGLGYFSAPDQYAPPQPLEHVKIEPEQLIERNGLYELRACEPMEEVAYIDRLELVAVDHPANLAVYPDERLAITGPAPTHRLLCPADPLFPVAAFAPDGSDCVEQLRKVDRVYAYQPNLDRRFYGFCEPHSLIMEFDVPDRLAEATSERGVYMFLNGWIEYPYSQTTFGASQAGITWQPMRIERLARDGTWETIVPDAGAPGGMGRMITVDLTNKLSAGRCRLRISTNLEIYYDQLFIASDRGTDGFAIQSVPMVGAELRRMGFPLEYSPDGRHPTIYSYDIIEPTSSFKIPRGAYTRYGHVEPLLAEFDDRYVILGSGDDLAVSFDAHALLPVDDGHIRSFILISHAYCKDMDLYTAAPDTVEPLPFKDMSAYPYPQGEHYPDTADARAWKTRFNTRRIE